MALRVIRLPGKVDYLAAASLQSTLIRQKLFNRDSEPDYLILLEHEPCVTLGRRSHSDLVNNSNVPVIKSARGGRATYHGPGQLTCYPILDLKRQPKLSLDCYVKSLALVMTNSLHDTFHLSNAFYDHQPDRVGLWLPGNRKIGFIGIQAQKWIVSHGFSINLRKEALCGFGGIDPCGLKHQNVEITCVEWETGIFDENVYKSVHASIIKNFTLIFNLKEAV